MRAGRLRRLVLAITVLDMLIVLAGPLVLFLAEPAATSTWQHMIRVTAVLAVVVLPTQCLALWWSLRREFAADRCLARFSRRLDLMIDEEALLTAFQPIVSALDGSVRGVEALARFTARPPMPPDQWFAAADRVGRGLELELLAVRTALRQAAQLPARMSVSINVSPATLASPLLLRTLLEGGVPPSRLVVEVTEHSSIEDYTPLQQARETLRRNEIRLAVDDAGAGYASFRHIVALAPEIIKIDRDIVTGIDQDAARRALVGAVVMYALEAGALVTAEGVETDEECQTLLLLGVDAMQGYLMGRPSVHPRDWQRWEHTALLRPSGPRVRAARQQTQVRPELSA